MSTALLEVRDLVKQYPSTRAVDDISFSVPEGVCFGLLGPNGAGKTTTVEIMEGILPPTSGELRYRGEPLGARFREEAGILFQKTALQDHLTVSQCIALFRGLYAHGLTVDEVIRICALEKLARRDARKLSGGQQQRLLLAIALVNDPAVLFLDEPTTGLDPQARRNFWELVQSIKARRKTIILTTHNMEEAELLCDEIAIMDRGRIIARGPPRRLLSEHFAEVLLELPRQEFPQSARALPLKLFDSSDRVEITTHDLEGTLRTLLEAKVPLTNLRIRPPNLEDLFLELTGKELRPMIRRLLSVWHARNLEFLRDRSTVIFTLLLPVMLVIGMGFVFGGPARPLFKVGVLGAPPDRAAHPFLSERYVQFVPLGGQEDALHKLTHQQVDLLVDFAGGARYWVNTDSPKGYIVERLLLAAEPGARRQPVTGAAVRYIDWLFPGILGMNMMFSCLFGVGYVVLRYRKSGFLKRLHATPLSAFEFLSAQVLSRLGLILVVTAILYAGIRAIIGFHSQGSLALLALLAILGALSLIALGLTVAARFSSEELVGGLLNLLTWPMMLLSGIWFSLEGSPRWVRWVADVFPLTHLLDAARAVMLDGAGLAQIAPHLLYLAATALVFLAFGAWSFRWRIE